MPSLAVTMRPRRFLSSVPAEDPRNENSATEHQ